MTLGGTRTIACIERARSVMSSCGCLMGTQRKTAAYGMVGVKGYARFLRSPVCASESECAKRVCSAEKQVP